MKKALALVLAGLFLLATPLPVNAADFKLTNLDVAISETVRILTILGTTLSTLFLVKAGYQYMTSAGNPEVISQAKTTMQRALIGMVIIATSYTFVHVLTSSHAAVEHEVKKVETNTVDEPKDDCKSTDQSIISKFFSQDNGGLGCTLSVAYKSFMQSMIKSAQKPLTDGVVTFLSQTAPVSQSDSIMKIWKLNVAIASALYVVVVALIGLQFMSATTFGFEELELKQIFPRIGIAYAGTVFSIYLIDSIIWFINIVVSTLSDNGNSLADTWVKFMSNPYIMATVGNMITIFFLLVLVIITAAFLLQYIGRAITIALGAVMSPYIFLIWSLPKGRGIAESAMREYIVALILPVVNLIQIQVAIGFLDVLRQSNNNSFLSVIMSIGIIFSLLKTPSVLSQLMQNVTQSNMYQKGMGQLMNILSPSPVGTAASTAAKSSRAAAAKSSSRPRKSKKS